MTNLYYCHRCHHVFRFDTSASESELRVGLKKECPDCGEGTLHEMGEDELHD